MLGGMLSTSPAQFTTIVASMFVNKSKTTLRAHTVDKNTSSVRRSKRRFRLKPHAPVLFLSIYRDTVPLMPPCTNLGLKCLQLLGIHALSGCDTTSYPYGKGKIRALNTLLSGDFSGLADVVGEVCMTQEDLFEAALPFLTALYQQLPGISMESACFNLLAMKKNRPEIMALPPTFANLSHDILRAHLQVMLWKAVDHQAPPSESTNITHFTYN